MEPKVIGLEDIVIPRCCREGLDICKHIPQKQRKQKVNIAL